MCSKGNLFTLVILCIIPFPITSLLISSTIDKELGTSESKDTSFKVTNDPLSNKFLHDAQESTNFFSSDLGAPFDTSSDYGELFGNFPDLPYFPEFGEIIRISRTTSKPPFNFPDYVRDAFSERPVKSVAKTSPASIRDTTSYSDVSGEGRRSRRPPRPASSGTRTKVSKQNQTDHREKLKVVKAKSPNSSKDYPKIFRFTSDRVNLAEFDMKKKMNENYLTLTKGDELDSDKVKRNKFLILHGGVFEIERNGRLNLFPANY